MLDLGWTELLLIGIVALIVVGPKDLPVMFRTLGRYTGRLRAMAREFTRAMEEAADESGARDIVKDLRKVANPKATGLAALNRTIDFDEIDPFDEKGTKPAAPKGAGEAAPESTAKIGGNAAGAAVAGLDAKAAARDKTDDDAPPATDTPKT
ncbi:MAG: Sec-independent protein translocase protein TatB [Tropicimonas sp.]|uniref:Sec-independent protein translocase protein TatB n=1 Tax=Tropicimonas sp. TaxID=2067044 RepID=UPI003A839AD1